jgi:serine/threonine protein kinase
MAPEVITESLFVAASDIWSLGCTVLEMANGRAPFSSARDENIATVLFRIASLRAPPRHEYPTPVSPELAGLLDRCFVVDVTRRATARSLLAYVDELGLAAPTLAVV